MKTKHNLLITLLSISIILLAWADRAAAAARNIVVEYVTVTVSSLSTPTPLTSADTILVKNGGRLWVDNNAQIGSLTIGDTASSGNVVFIGSDAYTLTVTGDIIFGTYGNNVLDMTVASETIQVGGSFLATGAGSVSAGASTIEYNSTSPQNVTAKVGGVNPTIQYKNLVLSGIPTTGLAVKNFPATDSVSVQGALVITGKAVPVGNTAVTYGTLSTLLYNGSTNQVATGVEWPASLNVPVTINNTFLNGTVTLDNDKTLGAAANLTLQAGKLIDGGHTLTVQGNVANATQIQGPGKLVLAGTGPQSLTGVGNYGNVVLANNATSSLPNVATSPEPLINGRLIIQAGSKVALLRGHSASLLTYTNGAGTLEDQPAAAYGSSGSGAGTKNDNVFDSSASGTLVVNTKPAAFVSETLSTNAITYGDASITVSGNVTPPAYFATYGNGAQIGDPISIVISSGAGSVQTNTTAVLDSTGAYTKVVPTAGLLAGSYTVVASYQGGINLAPAANLGLLALQVGVKTIRVMPDNLSVIYGQPDPTLTYTYTPPLVGLLDAFNTNGLARAAGTNVAAYPIGIGSLAVIPASHASSYTISVDSSKNLNITPKSITVTLVPQSITYGQNDPQLNRSNVDFTISPQLIGQDSFGGALTRDKVGTVPGRNVGSYAISLGSLAAGPNGGANYTLSVPANGGAFLTINPLATAVFFAPANKAYGAADPTFTLTNNPPLQYSDGWSGKAGRDSGESVPGGYTIRQGTLSLTNAANYIVTFDTGGKLAITKVDVTVTAKTFPRAYGTPVSVPADLVSCAGFLAANNPAGVPAQTAPATTQPGLSPNIPVTQCIAASNYTFSVTNAGTDPNYNMKLGGTLSGTVTVTPAPLNVTAVNQTKVYDGQKFTGTYSVNYDGFSTACGDNQGNALTGTLVYGGNATNASSTNAGVYQIIPGGLASVKYAVANVPGWLTITAPPATNTFTGDLTWAGPSASGLPNTATSLAWMINKADGTAGVSNPGGWSLLKVTGTLNIAPTSPEQFRLDLVTMAAGSAAGIMVKFDPTRPYSWEIVRASNITGFDPAKIMLNYQAAANGGANLFVNPIFNGLFTVSISTDNKSLFLNFTPMGSTGGFASGGGYKVPVPDGYDVGTTIYPSDPSTLLGNIYNSDVDVLWLSPSTTNVSPQSPVTISLNVANLRQAIVGVDAYINFDSRFFVATTDAGAPVVAAGGGVWHNLITRTWNVGGDLDTVVAVALEATSGTTADGTVATIALTPTRTAVGTSRVVFRADGGQNATTNGTITTDIVPSALNAAAVLPGRVMTDEITVSGAGVGPVIDTPNIKAIQVQPHLTTVVNVRNNAGARTQTVQTSAGIQGSYPEDTSTASGPVVITIPASDPNGVGLKGPPTLVLSNSLANMVTVPCTTPNATVGPFVYNWTVTNGIAQGTWTAIVTAQDTLYPTNSTSMKTVPNAFTLEVNTNEVSGVVELQGLVAANRWVTFNTGVGPANQWDLTNLNFVGGKLLTAGAFQDVASFAAVVTNPPDAVSVGLRYGTVLNLSVLASNLVNGVQVGGVSAYIYGLEYGSISNLQQLASQLTNPQRAVDVYVQDQLSDTTIQALATYQSSQGANAAALTKDLLNDFNTIVLGPTIYDAVRFAGVCVTSHSGDTVAVNRGLLEDAYASCVATYTANYVPGKLTALTAQELSIYPRGSAQALAAGILSDFDTLTLNTNLWPIPVYRPPTGYDQGLYNQKIFLEVTLSTNTVGLLQQYPLGNQLTLLNQDLLQDAYPGQYQKAPLTPATVVAAQAFNPSSPATVTTFVTDVTTDLNTLIGGPRIYTPPAGSYDANGELGQLLASSSLTLHQQIRENRLLLELNYPEQLSQNSVNSYPEIGLATYRLVQIPSSATQVSAKTAWNLRVRKPLAGTVTFVNNGVPGAFTPGSTPASDYYLRAGDMNGDNQIDLVDYNILRLNYNTTAGGSADVNGDGNVDGVDYSLMKLNWGKKGDDPAQ